MKLNEFILHLQELAGEGHGDKDVMFQYNYGDHWRSTVAEMAENAEPMMVAWSAYHDQYKVLDEIDEDESKDNAAAIEVIIIG